MPRCSEVKPDGTPCERIVGASQSYCYSHDPARQEERRRNAARAGRGSPSPEIREVKGLLKDLYTAVLEGRVGRQAGAVANQILNTRLRAAELERRVRSEEALEHRIDELEEMLEEAERRTNARW